MKNIPIKILTVLCFVIALCFVYLSVSNQEIKGFRHDICGMFIIFFGSVGTVCLIALHMDQREENRDTYKLPDKS